MTNVPQPRVGIVWGAFIVPTQPVAVPYTPSLGGVRYTSFLTCTSL